MTARHWYFIFVETRPKINMFNISFVLITFPELIHEINLHTYS